MEEERNRPSSGLENADLRLISASAQAGIVAKSIVLPLSNITVQQQTAASSSAPPKATATDGSDDDSEDGTYDQTPGMLEVARDIVDQKGWTGLWAGMQASIVLTLNPSITFYAFDALKRTFVPRKHQAHPTALQTFLAGALASSIASTVTYPLILAKVGVPSSHVWRASPETRLCPAEWRMTDAHIHDLSVLE